MNRRPYSSAKSWMPNRAEAICAERSAQPHADEHRRPQATRPSTIVTHTGASVGRRVARRCDHRRRRSGCRPASAPSHDGRGLADADAGLVGIDARRGDLGTGHELDRLPANRRAVRDSAGESRRGRERQHPPAATILQPPSVGDRQASGVAFAQVVVVRVAAGREIVEPDDRPAVLVRERRRRRLCATRCANTAGSCNQIMRRSDAVWWMHLTAGQIARDDP